MNLLNQFGLAQDIVECAGPLDSVVVDEHVERRKVRLHLGNDTPQFGRGDGLDIAGYLVLLQGRLGHCIA